MAALPAGGDERGGGLPEKEDRILVLNCGDADAVVAGVSCNVGGPDARGFEVLSSANLTDDPKAGPMEIRGEDGDNVVVDPCITPYDLDIAGNAKLATHNLDHETHVSYDLEESRVLQIQEGQIASQIEISRTISTVVGPVTTDRHLGTWEKIELILASIPRAKNALIPRPASKLKVRDFRKIHTQEGLNINQLSSQASLKPWKHILKPNTAQLLLTSSEPLPTKELTNKPSSFRSSRPSKSTRTLKPSPHNRTPNQKDTLPTPSPEWMVMMDRSIIQEPSQEGSSRTLQGSGKDKTNPWVKTNKTMADMLKDGQPKP